MFSSGWYLLSEVRDPPQAMQGLQFDGARMNAATAACVPILHRSWLTRRKYRALRKRKAIAPACMKTAIMPMFNGFLPSSFRVIGGVTFTFF